MTLSVVMLCTAMVSCSRDGNLSTELDLVGDNRAELEKVLSHYSGEPEKLQAAEWLVSNMPGHPSVGGEAVRAFCDSVMHRAMTKPEADSLWKAISVSFPKPEIRTDLQTMSAGFLIDNIDAAFKTWKGSPWRDSVSFESLLRHVLPYRIADEPLRTGWRDSLAAKFSPLLKGVSDPRRAFEIVRREIFSQGKTKPLEYPYPMDAAAYRNYFSTVCKERCIHLAGACRAVGLPVAYDNCGRWANYSDNVHSWVSLVLPGGTYTVVDDDSVARKLNRIDASGYVLAQPLPEGYPYDGVSATLIRKYPISPGKLNGYARMPGTRIVAGRDSGFRNPVTLYTLTDVPVFHNTAYVTLEGRYRCLWVETDPPVRHYIDKLVAYGPDGKVIESEGKRGLDFGRRVEIARIDYYPRSDGNFVEPGDDYELTWWDGTEWRSLGKRHSEGYELRYDNIPEGALLLLHDLTKGKEERPFTLQNGRQVWW